MKGRPWWRAVGIACAIVFGFTFQGQAVENSQMKHFSFKPGAAATTVTLAGDWLGWTPDGAAMAKQPDGSYSAELSVPDGRHLYKFVVDGKTWLPDPANPEREPDTYGGFNSVLIVGDSKAAAKEPAKPAAANGAITFPVKQLPDDFQAAWIPVRYENGSLEYDGSKESGSILYLSAKPLELPATRAKDGATTSFPPRQIFVWLPRKAADKKSPRLPVIYLHDGQNVWDDKTCCFGHGGWGLNETMDKITTLPRAILVGVPNGPARMAEYGLGTDILNLQDTDYLRFLRAVVKPRIDKDFPTLKAAAHTTVMGSSMGGVISIFAAYRNPEIFGNAVAMSTAFQIPDSQHHTLIELLEKKGKGAFRLYLDSGTGGQARDGALLTRKFAELAEGKGWEPGKDFLHFEDTGAEHNEESWRKRSWRALEFALTPSQGARSK